MTIYSLAGAYEHPARFQGYQPVDRGTYFDRHERALAITIGGYKFLLFFHRACAGDSEPTMVQQAPEDPVALGYVSVSARELQRIEFRLARQLWTEAKCRALMEPLMEDALGPVRRFTAAQRALNRAWDELYTAPSWPGAVLRVQEKQQEALNLAVEYDTAAAALLAGEREAEKLIPSYSDFSWRNRGSQWLDGNGWDVIGIRRADAVATIQEQVDVQNKAIRNAAEVAGVPQVRPAN